MPKVREENAERIEKGGDVMENKKRLIDANALFEFLKEQKEKETGAYLKGRNNGINVALGAIKNEQICPTVDAVQVIHSQWEITDVDHAHGGKCYHCPECGEDEWRHNEPNYCPNCGAKMEGDQNETQ